MACRPLLDIPSGNGTLGHQPPPCVALFVFNWSTVNLQCVLVFGVQQIDSYYTYLYILFHFLFHLRLLQDIELPALHSRLAPQVALVVKNSPDNTGDLRDTGFHPWVGMIPWRRKWQPAPAFLPGEVHGQRSLVGYGPLGHKESDMSAAT